MKKIILLLVFITKLTFESFSQPDRWQQKIAYNINVTVNDEKNQFSGTEKIDYFNNSPDTLKKLFFHAYWNAFQPNSSMDVRSRELGKVSARKDKKGNPVPDWDGRVKDRISKLSLTEIGYQKINQLIINGVEQKTVNYETIIEIQLTKPILPKSKTTILLNFEAQVPIQIRRSGRDNAEGVKYSMSQWYPKMVEYDYNGWNTNPYIAREFYGVWGDFDVTINIDKKYVVAATGILTETDKNKIKKSNTITTSSNLKSWNFKGQNIHDFVWAADANYKVVSKKVRPNLTFNVYYLPKDASADSAWQNILYCAEKVLPYIESRFGAYPYPQYSFIQGGDGGMEYAMATLLKGPGLGTIVHEWMHSWYQHILGTNESLCAWMDEGFTTYAENEVMDFYNTNWAVKSPFISNAEKIKITNDNISLASELPLKQADDYKGYFALVKSGFEEPLSTHADHFNSNFGYSVASYSKGSVFLTQLGYIIGDKMRDKVLLEYYNQWKFKHPNPNDFIRIAEKVSGLQLQWYKEYWVNSTKTIDYKIGNIFTDSITGKPTLTLERIGKMPMPIDVLITYKDGSKEYHYIPLNLMYGNKQNEFEENVIVEEAWKWTHPTFNLFLNKKINDIKSVEIDATQRMADINRLNNKLVIPN